jgi:FkbM family methyltransferase
MKPKKGRMVSVYFKKYAPKNGFYVEIGAYDGVSKNSTKILEANGWDGACIEAHPERFKKLEQNRNCRCINGAVWNNTGIVDFALMPEKKRGWDGIVKTLADRAKHYLLYAEIIEIKSYTWKDLNLPLNINYLQIDVEGAELEILKHIDFKKYNIDYICLEDNEYFHSKDTTYRDFMTSVGYTLIEELGVDTLYKKI